MLAKREDRLGLSRSVLCALLALGATVSTSVAQVGATPTPNPQGGPGATPTNQNPTHALLNERQFTFPPEASMERISSILSSCKIKGLTHLYTRQPVPLTEIAQAIKDAPVSKGETQSRADFPLRAARGIGVSPAKEMDATFRATFNSPDDSICAETKLRNEKLISKSSKPHTIRLLQDTRYRSIPDFAPTSIPASMKIDRSYMRALDPILPPGTRLRARPILGVVDSGVDTNHPDLLGAILVNKREIPGNKKDDDGNGLIDDVLGASFACQVDTEDPRCNLPSADGDIRDFVGHGTHVSGIAMGREFIQGGVRGIAPTAALIPVRVSSKDGATPDVAAGIRYATDRGADAINLSLGWYLDPFELDVGIEDAIRYARANGTVVVFAAGNEESPAYMSAPCNLPQPICVSAVEATAKSLSREKPRKANVEFASFSNFGGQIDVTAPGVDIWSSVPCLKKKGTPPADMQCSFPKDYYEQMSGTSMAAPHVAALAALVAAMNPRLNPDQIKSVIQLSAIDAFIPGYDGLAGAGLMNVRGALELANAMFVGERPAPSTLQILEPVAIEQVVLGQTVPVGFEAVSSGASSYTLAVHDLFSDQVLFSKTGRSSGSQLHRVDVDTSKIGAGQFLIEVSLTDQQGITVKEWRDLQVRRRTQSPKIPAREEGNSLNTKGVVKREEHKDRLWELSLESRTTNDQNSLTSVLQEQFLSFSPTGVTISAPTIVGSVTGELANVSTWMRYPDEVGIYYVNYDADSSTVGFGTFNPTNHDFIVDHAANETCPNFSEFFFSHKGAYVASTSARSLFIRKGSRGRFIEIPVESSGRPIFDTQARTLVVPSQDSGEILVVPLSTQRAQEYLAKGSYPVREVTRVPLRTPDGALDTIVDVDGSNILLERRMASQEDPSAAGIRTLGILSTDTQRWLPLTTSDVNWNGDYPAVVKDENAYYPIEGKASEFFGRKPITLIIKRDLKTGAEKALHQEFVPMSTFSFSWFKLSSGALLLENDKAVGESVFIFQEYGAN